MGRLCFLVMSFLGNLFSSLLKILFQMCFLWVFSPPSRLYSQKTEKDGESVNRTDDILMYNRGVIRMEAGA